MDNYFDESQFHFYSLFMLNKQQNGKINYFSLKEVTIKKSGKTININEGNWLLCGSWDFWWNFLFLLFESF